MWLLTLLLACERSAAPAGRPPASQPPPLPEVTEVQAVLEQRLPELLRLDVREALDAYLSITTAVAPGAPCPPYLETFEGPGYRTRYFGYFLEDGRCTLDSGGEIDGYGEEYRYWSEGSDDYHFDEVLLEGTFTSPEGFSLSGYTYLDELHRVRPDLERRYLGLVGDLAWSGPLVWSGGDLTGSWLEWGYGAYLEESWSRDAEGTVNLTVTGGLDGFDGPLVAIAAQDLAVRTAEPGCAAEPRSGTLGARDASGRWVELDWGDPCDGCAEATLDGEALGALCLDLDALALELPW